MKRREKCTKQHKVFNEIKILNTNRNRQLNIQLRKTNKEQTEEVNNAATVEINMSCGIAKSALLTEKRVSNVKGKTILEMSVDQEIQITQIKLMMKKAATSEHQIKEENSNSYMLI